MNYTIKLMCILSCTLIIYGCSESKNSDVKIQQPQNSPIVPTPITEEKDIQVDKNKNIIVQTTTRETQSDIDLFDSKNYEVLEKYKDFSMQIYEEEIEKEGSNLLYSDPIDISFSKDSMYGEVISRAERWMLIDRGEMVQESKEYWHSRIRYSRFIQLFQVIY